ncbi:MAG: M20/M25/M40 family metallo-hydrolase [Candidatus Micrarchaeota archaeon]|nr:M20/M25/M40 family metallo-hydrolase [Candidatus Micrarchaeota archaeon]
MNILKPYAYIAKSFKPSFIIDENKAGGKIMPSEKQFKQNILSTDQRTRVVESLGSLVAVKTVSGEQAAPDYEGFGKALQKEAAMRGLGCEQIGAHVGNWLVKMPNEDPEKQTILIAVHADVVPVGEMKNWKTGPFEFTVDGDKAYGRGAADCKSGIVVGLEAMHRLLQEKNSKVNVQMLVGRDEETGSELGFKYLAESGLLKADAALVWDTRPVITVASSGVIGAKTGFHGKTKDALGIFDAIMEYAGKREKIESVCLATEAPRPNVWGRVTPTMINFHIKRTEGISVDAIWAGEKTNSVPGSCYVSFGIPDDFVRVLGGAYTITSPKKDWQGFVADLRGKLSPGFEIIARNDDVGVDAGGPSGQIEIIGKGGHAGYTHQTLNPIPEAIRLVREYITGKTATLAMLGVDARALPEEDIMKIKGELIEAFKKGAGSGTGLILDDGKWSMHAPCMLEKNPVNDSLVRQVQSAFAGQGLETGIYGGLGGLDLDMLIKVGIPSLAAGPQNQSIHGPNEYVSLPQIEKFVNLTVDLAVNWERLPSKTGT